MAQFTRERLERESKNRDKRNREPFEYVADNGETFVFRHPQKVHLSNLTRMGSGNLLDNMRALLGDEPYERFMALPEVDGELTEDLFDAYNAHYGFDQGE